MADDGRVLDLRSDTRTHPDAVMRAAMADAEVGDDAFDDDPTVHRLQTRAAQLLGTEAALLTCSGTMSNVLATLLVTGPAGGRAAGGRSPRIVVGADSHLLLHENGGLDALAGAEAVVVPTRDGVPDVPRTVAALDAGADLLWLENTSNIGGGNAMDAATTATLTAAARGRGVPTHLDGARVVHAAVTHGCPPATLTAGATTVSLSLCKALGGPAGSVLAGDADTMVRARWLRRMVGGTLHQAGVLAAAGLVALGRTERLADDHRRADALRTGLTRGGAVDVETVPHPTNMVFFRVPPHPASLVAERLAGRGIAALPVDETRIRLVVHLGHDDHDVTLAAERISALAHDLVPRPRQAS